MEALLRSRRMTCAFWIALTLSLSASMTPKLQAQLTANKVRWKVQNGDANARVLMHQRILSAANESACDVIRLHAGYGTQAYAFHQIKPVRVISELEVSIPVRADRPGLQALVRVVLPRSAAENGNDPVRVLVPGSMLEAKGEWEELRVDNIPTMLERQVRSLRLSRRGTIDAREAYVDMVLVNVYGGAGETNVSLGDPTILGAVDIPKHGMDSAAVHAVSYRSHSMGIPSAENGMLYGGGRPLFVRMIDDHGESWERLRELGINTVRLGRTATVEQLAIARKLGLWIVSPPPNSVQALPAMKHFDRILAWDLGSACHERIQSEIPTVCTVVDSVAELSGRCEILIHQREIPFASSAFIGDTLCDGQRYQRWLQRRFDQSNPQSVHWVAVETQPHPLTIDQARLLGCARVPRLDPAEVSDAVQRAIACGARGVYFRSRSQIDKNTPEDRLRSATVGRINRALDIINPWIAAGQLQPITNTANGQLVRFESKQAALYQFIADGNDGNVLLPSVDDARHVFGIGAGGLTPLAHHRVAGGTEIQLPRGSATHWLLVTRDESIVRTTAERINLVAQDMARFRSDQLQVQISRESSPALREQHDAFLAELASNDWVGVHETGSALANAIKDERSATAHRLRTALTSATACALATHSNTHRELADFLKGAPRARHAVNLLPGGGFDEAHLVVESGWSVGYDEARAMASVMVDDSQPRAGKGSLRLEAGWKDAVVPVADDRAVAWVSGPRINLAAGQMVRVDGWVRIDEPLDGAEFVIYDSIAGPALGLRYDQTNNGWLPFTMYRAAGQSTHFELRFGMTGPGTVHLDEISITPMTPSGSIDTVQFSRSSRP